MSFQKTENKTKYFDS